MKRKFRVAGGSLLARGDTARPALELNTSLVLAAAIKQRDRADDARLFAAAAKIKADKSAKSVAYSAFQLHGSIATTDALPIGHS